MDEILQRVQEDNDRWIREREARHGGWPMASPSERKGERVFGRPLVSNTSPGRWKLEDSVESLAPDELTEEGLSQARGTWEPAWSLTAEPKGTEEAHLPSDRAMYPPGLCSPLHGRSACTHDGQPGHEVKSNMLLGRKAAVRPRKSRGVSTQTDRVFMVDGGTQTCVRAEHQLYDLDALDTGEGEVEANTLRITVDSGAAESVMPDRDSPGIEWVEKPARRLYRAANGSTMKDQGAKRVSYVGPDGKARAMTFRIADVTKPLASVARMCDRGNRVVFDSDGSYVEHKKTGARTHLSRHNGVFVLEVPLGRRGEGDDSSGFTRRGM